MLTTSSSAGTAHSEAAHPEVLPRLLGQEVELRTALHEAVRVTQLNNAATTPPFVATIGVLQEFLLCYGALHRGAGPRARHTCEFVERAQEQIRRFVGCSPDHVVLFADNTSGAINLLVRLLSLQADDVVLTSELEHTSNYLPWRFNSPAQVVEVAARNDGSLVMEDLERKVQAAGSRLKVIALSGASNLTGYRPDLKAISRLAEAAGALLFVDAAQLAPHRPIDMARDGIGALAFSAHKLYAPFGVGALVLPRSVLNRAPVNPGGGSIDMITDRSIVWAPIDERHQSGTWNAAGIVALGASCETMSNAGWSAVLHHERALVAYSVERLSSVPGLTLRVPAECYLAEDRIGTFPFSFDGYHPFLLAAILEHEYGIEVRAGTICNHRLVRRWLAAGDAQQDDIECQIKAGNRLASYGIVRASLGIQSTHEDLDRLCNALTSIRTHGPKLEYKPLPQHECYDVA